MSVINFLAEFGGDVSWSVMREDAVERDDIMILNGLAYSSPPELLIERVEILEHFPPNAIDCPDHIILDDLYLVQDLVGGGCPQADAVVDLAETEALRQGLP